MPPAQGLLMEAANNTIHTPTSSSAAISTDLSNIYDKETLLSSLTTIFRSLDMGATPGALRPVLQPTRTTAAHLPYELLPLHLRASAAFALGRNERGLPVMQLPPFPAGAPEPLDLLADAALREQPQRPEAAATNRSLADGTRVREIRSHFNGIVHKSYALLPVTRAALFAAAEAGPDLSALDAIVVADIGASMEKEMRLFDVLSDATYVAAKRGAAWASRPRRSPQL